jgi:peptide/nickel transport system permease protein
VSGFSVRFFALKLVRFVATIVMVTFLTTLTLTLVPGSPALEMAGIGATPQQIAIINQEYGFNESPFVRYWQWLTSAFHGDLGRSFFTKQQVVSALHDRLPVTLELAVLASILTVTIALLVATFTVRKPGGPFDYGVRTASYAQISLPAFVLALGLAWLFAVKLRILPLLGFVPLTESVGGNLEHMILPVLALTLGPAAGLTVVLRADLLQTLQQDYIMLARAKGHSTRSIIWKHALKPSSFSLVTLSTLHFAALLGGTVIIEQIFLLPGMGSLLLNSIESKDYPVATSLVSLIAVAFLTVNFLTDIAYSVMDPRIRIAGIRSP